MAKTLQIRKALESTASRLDFPVAWLDRLIQFESSYDPQAQNPDSSARGAIQFMDDTAQDMGYNSSKDLTAKNPTIEGQIEGPVYEYLKRYVPFPTEQSLFMAVFYPIYRDAPADLAFPPHVQAVNEPIKTPGEYMAFVNKELKEQKTKNNVKLAGVAVLIIGAIYALSQAAEEE